METLPLVLLSPLLIYMGYCDLRYMRIPNTLVLAMVGVFALTAPFLPIESVGARVLAASFVFAIGFVTFALRLFGGGDVKALTALMLFIPPQTWPIFGLVFSASMLLGIVFVVTMQTVSSQQHSGWVSLRARGMFPMGISIAASGLLHPVVIAALLGV